MTSLSFFAEDFKRQSLAIDRDIRIEDSAAEFLDNRAIGRPTRQKNFMTQLIRLNQLAAKPFQRRADKALSAGEAARQSYFQHSE